jgi:probable HAF family extracellular repeat protein
MKIARGAILLALMLGATPALALRHYTITDLGNPGDYYSYGRAINNQGAVVGYYETDDGDLPLYAAPNATAADFSLSGIAGYDGRAVGINNGGQIALTASSDDGTFAYRYTPGVGFERIALLPDQDSGAAVGINASGAIAGTDYQIRNHGNVSEIHAYSDTPGGGGPVDLGAFGDFAYAYAINASGQIAGQSNIGAGDDPLSVPYAHAFLYTPGVGMADIDPLGRSSHARAINDLG